MSLAAYFAHWSSSLVHWLLSGPDSCQVRPYFIESQSLDHRWWTLGSCVATPELVSVADIINRSRYFILLSSNVTSEGFTSFTQLWSIDQSWLSRSQQDSLVTDCLNLFLLITSNSIHSSLVSFSPLNRSLEVTKFDIGYETVLVRDYILAVTPGSSADPKTSHFNGKSTRASGKLSVSLHLHQEDKRLRFPSSRPSNLPAVWLWMSCLTSLSLTFSTECKKQLTSSIVVAWCNCSA